LVANAYQGVPRSSDVAMIGRFADCINSRRWFIRWLILAEYLLLASFAIGILLLKT